MITLAEVNAMDRAAFVQRFGDIAEHSPWVAASAADARPFASREDMIAAFTQALRHGETLSQIDTLRAHPDLATRARLTPDSSREQAGAGLDMLTPDEFSRFTALNSTYKAKFGFPFIFAVKGATKRLILESFERRISNTRDAELEIALQQVCRIFRFRLEDRVSA